ncbi:MAG: hypothetical protein ACRDTJ_21025 [Pseudonocardiaceae bacterium]
MAAQTTIQVATPHTIPISQQQVTTTIERVFTGRVETTVTESTERHYAFTGNGIFVCKRTSGNTVARADQSQYRSFHSADRDLVCGLVVVRDGLWSG